LPVGFDIPDLNATAASQSEKAVIRAQSHYTRTGSSVERSGRNHLRPFQELDPS
jgi:hypothetical protein